MDAYGEAQRRGPEILPDTWEYEWVASVVAKAAEYAGRPSHWNGKLYEQPGQVSGIYQPDGSMTISREHVLDPARPAFTPEHTATPDELSAAAGATQMAVYQARLSLSEFGDDSLPGATPLGSPADLALERGRADRFTQQYGSQIAADLTDQPLPMSIQPSAFPAYAAATTEMMYPLVPATMTSLDQLTELIDTTERTQRFNALADRVIDHQLGNLVPESHRAQLREDLTGPLRRCLGDLAMTENSQVTDSEKAQWGERSAQYAGLEFAVNLSDIKDHYTSWNTQNPGVEPPELPDSLRDTFRDREEEAREFWANSGWAAQGNEEHAQVPEVEELRRFLWEHTAPSQQGSTTVDASGRPNNVRDIGSRKPERGV